MTQQSLHGDFHIANEPAVRAAAESRGGGAMEQLLETVTGSGLADKMEHGRQACE